MFLKKIHNRVFNNNNLELDSILQILETFRKSSRWWWFCVTVDVKSVITEFHVELK